jgi:hypothetical protein
VDHLQDFDLAADALHVGLLADQLLLQHFHGHLHACGDVLRLFYFAEGALAQGLVQSVVADCHGLLLGLALHTHYND